MADDDLPTRRLLTRAQSSCRFRKPTALLLEYHHDATIPALRGAPPRRSHGDGDAIRTCAQPRFVKRPDNHASLCFRFESSQHNRSHCFRFEWPRQIGLVEEGDRTSVSGACVTARTQWLAATVASRLIVIACASAWHANSSALPSST